MTGSAAYRLWRHFCKFCSVSAVIAWFSLAVRDKAPPYNISGTLVPLYENLPVTFEPPFVLLRKWK
jgi:hypothetical protein